MKTQILEAIGEMDAGRSAQMDAALAANDRIKYCFSLLQAALAHADHPAQPGDPLRRERLACGVENNAFDDVVTELRPGEWPLSDTRLCDRFRSDQPGYPDHGRAGA
jgi:hypothetical protein